ncbi:MAG: hypothetical protein HY048_02940 [Acidobacteria bacterium]|nr:hypothetical protein [Acidobacteriota bacterium]
MLSTFLVACVESCRVGIARAGMNLPQSIVIAAMELGRHALRSFRRL